MTKSLKIPPELRKALSLFISELDTHLDYFDQTLTQLDELAKKAEQEATSFAAKEAKTMEHRFHLIKGGAGFLQLDEIADAATDGEAMFKGGELKQEINLVHSLKKLVDVLAEQRKDLKDYEE